jgi:phosphoglycerate kinase
MLEESQVGTCQRLLASVAASGKRILLPTDIVALSPGGTFGAGKEPDGEVRQLGPDVPDGWTGLDIGPGTAAAFADEIASAATVFWNGPMGVFEDPRFAAGTKAVAEAVASAKGFTVVGGGDSASALKQFGLDDQVDHLSTGGGASLEFIEKGDLPGLAALRQAADRARA